MASTHIVTMKFDTFQSLGDEELDDELENVEESQELSARTSYLNHLKLLRESQFELPKTVSLIECPNGTKVYLVGTAHFSKDSIDDVRYIMEKTLPDVVVVELCKNRSHSMLLSEEEIKRQIQENNLSTFIKNMGLSNGILQYLLLRFTNYIMQQIGMAPGGEFRAAFQEVSKQPHCHLILGDRSIKITLQRAMDALGLWQKTKILCSLLFGFEKITPEEVEEMKREDLLEQLIKTLAGDYPELTRTILEERDLYLARSIWEVCGLSSCPNSSSTTSPGMDCEVSGELRQRHNEETNEGTQPEVCVARLQCCPEWPGLDVLSRVVVAVVGIGHVAGIKKAWESAATIDKTELIRTVWDFTPRFCRTLKEGLTDPWSRSYNMTKWICIGVFHD
uniref:TraB domain-containing protein n=1 Tax=Mesocestoides corti TaxID=53468 RepID=A0A5K3ESJ8_MESCO